MIHARLWFSGSRLYLLNGPSTQSWLAVSGRPQTPAPGNLHFSYSVQAQAAKDQGPLPAGEYAIRTGDIRTYQHTPKTLLGAAVFAATEFRTDILPRYNAAWGKVGGATGRIVPILNSEGGSDYGSGRNNCWIHGSDAPGSIGCIDLVGGMDAFLSALLALKLEPSRMVSLIVRYGVAPDGTRESFEIDARGRDISRIA